MQLVWPWRLRRHGPLIHRPCAGRAVDAPPRPRSVDRLSSDPHSADRARGALAAAGAFFIWGVVPVYWKQMQGVSAFELIAHRSTWSLVLLAWQGRFAGLRSALLNR